MTRPVLACPARDPQAPANMVAELQKPQHELQDQKFPNLGEASLSAPLSGAEIVRFGLKSQGTALPGIVVLVINATERISLLHPPRAPNYVK